MSLPPRLASPSQLPCTLPASQADLCSKRSFGASKLLLLEGMFLSRLTIEIPPRHFQTPSGTMTSSSLPKVFQCGCGQFKFSLSGQPVSNFNCHCHSCVAAARYIDENPGKDGNGTSNIDGSAGVALSCYKLANAAFPEDKDPRLGMGSVKVGDGGKMLRYFTTCCGTPVLVSEAKFSVLMVNRNALYVDDDCKVKYTPERPALNIMTKYCFGDKADIASPKCDVISLGALLSFIPLMLSSAMGFGYGPNKFSARKEDLDQAEVCPITWE